MDHEAKYDVTMDFLQKFFEENFRAAATGLPAKYCEDMWDKLVYCPFEMTLFKDFVLFKNPYHN